MVGIAGLEPATSRPPDARATRLRYIPIAGYDNKKMANCNLISQLTICLDNNYSKLVAANTKLVCLGSLLPISKSLNEVHAVNK